MKKLLALSYLAIATLILGGCEKVVAPIINASEAVQAQYLVEQQKTANKTAALVKCQELCQQTLSNNGQDFDVGPCLSNDIAPDWVCDIAHNPRQEVDDDLANQCEAFRNGRAHHFVEVDGNCNVIKSR